MDGAVLRSKTIRPPDVRVALPADEDAVFALLVLAEAENAMAPMNEDKVREAIQSCTRRKGGVIGLIDAPDGTPAAACGITMTPWWYSNQWHCEDLWNFVHPDHRRSDYAKQLLSFGKWWADQLGMDYLTGVLSLHRTEGKVRLYRRSLTCVGALFLHRGGALTNG